MRPHIVSSPFHASSIDPVLASTRNLRRNVYADNWPRQMEDGGDYGVFDLARLYSFGYLPTFPPSAIPSYMV